MSEINLVSPLLDGLKQLEQFSSRGKTECYFFERSETGEQFVLKHISIPESDAKTQALILTGAVTDEQDANQYYQTVADALRNELEIIRMFPAKSGFSAWGNYQIEARENLGFDVYALMPRKNSLKDHLQDRAITQLQALNLGIDLCGALEILHKVGFAYLNLKPENIFIDEHDRFSIGDFGLVPLDGLGLAAVPEDYINDFSAPELSKLIPEPNETSDLYSLGMLLFYIFNANRLPDKNENIDAEGEKQKSDEALPSPDYADYELAEIIAKACSPDPAQRYATPAELRQALTLYMQRNDVSDQLLVSPIIDESEEAQTAGMEIADVDDPISEAPPESDPDEAAQDEDLMESEPADAETPKDAESIEQILASVNDVLSEDEHGQVANAPDLEANEAALRQAEPQKKKKVWLPILICLPVLAVIGAALVYLYFNWYVVRMSDLKVVDQTADSFTLAYTLSSPDPNLAWECIDTYGNSYSGVGGEGRVQFRDLLPAGQYMVRFYPGSLHKLIGATTITAATANPTEIVSMSAVQAQDNTTATVTIVVSGPEPEQWILTYSSSDSKSGSVIFSGHSVEVPGLKLHDTYTFELQAAEDIYLSGETSCTLQMLADVQAKDLLVAYASKDSLTITWESEADSPLSWSARCVGEGYDETLEVTKCVATFPGTRLDTAYTFTVSADGLEVPLSMSLPANARIITSLNAEATDAGTVHVSWTSTDPQPDNGWVVCYLIDGDSTLSGSVSIAEESEVLLSGMPAHAEIVVTLEPANGESVIGATTLTTETPEAPDFDGHEFSVADTELKLYASPENADWTFDDLGDSAEEFDPDVRAVAVLTAPEDYTTYDTDDTRITLVLRSETGKVAGYASITSAWADLWDEGRYLTPVWLPKTPGSYQIELYFDNRFVNRRVITITGAEDSDQSE